MIAPEDINQIKGVVQEAIGQSISPLEKRLDGIAVDIKTMKTDLQATKKDTGKIQKDLKIVIDFFDRDGLELRGRVERIEKHLGISPLS